MAHSARTGSGQGPDCVLHAGKGNIRPACVADCGAVESQDQALSIDGPVLSAVPAGVAGTFEGEDAIAVSAAAPTQAKAPPAPPQKDLSGLMPYLRRYTGGIVLGLLTVLLMGIIGNFIPLATGVMTDTLAGNPVPFEHSTATHERALVPGLSGSALSRSIPYYAPNSRKTLGIYCLM